MFFPNSEALPDRSTASFDEVFAVRVFVDPQIDSLLMKDATTMEFDEATDCSLDLTQLCACAEGDRQMKE
jgi:hypothetical protein